MTELGELHEQEHSTEDALFSIDLALPGVISTPGGRLLVVLDCLLLMT